MPDCFSNTPYNYQELDYPCWGSPFKFNPGNIYQDSALSQQLYNHDVNTILSTPISYPKVSTPYGMSRPNTSVFQSSNTKAQQVETPHDSLSFELLNGPEAIYNQSRPREQSSAIEPRQQSEKPGESATQSMSPAHLSNSRQLEHCQPYKSRYSCGWQGCSYEGHFKSEATLMRHISSIHVSPNKFKCEYCGKGLNRKDRYKAHVQMVHLGKS